MRRMRNPLLIVLTACLLSSNAIAQETSALINKALDEQVKLSINKTLPEAMEAIREQTGVRLEASPAVWELLPWGRDTNVNAKIENHTLREALTFITCKLGLTFVLRDEAVEIQPTPALKRLGQRASIQELRALDLLASTALNANPGRPTLVDRPTIRQLLETIDLKLAATKDADLGIENRLGDAVDQNQTVFVPRNASLLDALESMPKETKATWYPWGKSILVVTKEDRTRALLGKSLTIRVGPGGADLLQVLTEIATRTGVPFDYQPGVMQAIPAEARTIRGIIENVPALQILSNISAAAGLAYTIQDDKVHVSAPAAATTGSGARDPIVGMVQLDSGIQVLIPASEVPPDIREYLRFKTKKALGKIREMMIDENFKYTPPATQPATTDHEL